MMSVSGGSEGSGDILSIALEQSGLDSGISCHPTFLSSEMTTEFFTSLDKSNGDAFGHQTPSVSSNGYDVADTPYQLMPPNGVGSGGGGGGVGIDFGSRMDISPQVGVFSMEDELTGLINSKGLDCLPSYPPVISSVSSFPQPSTVNNTYTSQSNNDIDDVLEELGIINTSVPETVTTPYSSCAYSGIAGPMGPMDLPFTQQNTYSVQQQPSAVMLYQQQRSVISPMMPIEPTSRTAMTPPLPPSTTRESPQALTPQPQLAEEDLDEEEDQFTAAETYANYRPAKLKIGIDHPDPIVESSSLSSVDPPQVWFDLKFPSEVVEEAKLSSLQLEAIVYSCQQHMNILTDGTRAGFLIGDGAGVGKGRTVAGIIYQNYLEGRKKAIWLSVSNDLKFDAIRDLQDVGAKKIKVYSLNKFHYGKISGKRNGRVRKGVIFTTYSSLIGESASGGKYRTRLNQLLHWLGSQFDGVIVFDECHKAKNLVPSGAGRPSKTGLTVLEMQKKLPKARVVYCSATGASEPRNMAYMSRLGIWGRGTQFPDFQDFIKSVERRGVGAMEIVAMDMKLRGLYIARQLSFAGVNFSIHEVPLSPQFIQMYDSSVAFWVEARAAFKEAAELMDYDKRGLKTMWGQFWASHQRFFKYLCIASKVDKAIELAKAAIKDGKCVVIGLQSTGEARTLEQLEQSNGELAGFVSTAKGVLEALVRKHFPSPPAEGIINWTLCDNDTTLPSSCRKRKRACPVGKTVMSESEESSSSGEDNDSAVESSSDDDDEDSDDDDDSDEDSNNGNRGELFDSLGIDTSWLTKTRTKAKRRKTTSSRPVKKVAKNGNYSLKPPAASTPFPGVTEFKFNTKTLSYIKEEHSPKERRRQSMAVVEGINAPKRSPPFERRSSVQIGLTDRQSLVDVAMASGANSCIRNVAVRKLKAKLTDMINELSPHLPTNSLDHLIDGLGGPSYVAEMTGRRGRVVCLPDGTIQYQLRAEAEISVELLNITEKQRFMDGEKNVAIISEAASSGISLQADRRAKNQKRRVHVTLELPWSADKAIQQFGRTHRSNQVNAPEYVFLISELSGEHRFASIVAKRLESLGALTHGDRRATESRDLSKYNIDNKYGRQSLETVLKSLVGSTPPMVDMAQYGVKFTDEARVGLTNVELLTHEREGVLSVDKESLNLSRFLNRLLGLPVLLQNSVFSYFTDTLAAYIQQAKRAGKWDGGIWDFGASEELVQIVSSKEFVGDAAFGTATTQLHKIRIERGISFSEALNKLNADYKPGEGFYLSKHPRNNKHVAVMLKVSKEGSNMFLVHRPNTGLQSRTESMKHLLKKYNKSTSEEAEQWWSMQYEATLTTCIHACWRGRCKLGPDCEAGRRLRAYHILTGSLLGIWTQLERVFQRHPTHSHRMQIVRVHTTGRKLVGISIPSSCVSDLEETLHGIAEEAAGTVS